MPLSLIQLWLGPLSQEEINSNEKPNFFLYWFAHPVKRRLAKYYLWFLQKLCGLKVIALTGSAGKTTTKEILISLLPNSQATSNNTTSTFNIPTTILKVHPGLKYLILEMGVEYPGDMDFYTWLAHPDIAIILNVSPTHLQFMGSIAGVAYEKTKIFKYAKIAIQPAGFPSLPIPTYTFGFSPKSYCQIISSQLTPNLTTKVKLLINSKPYTYNLPLVGEHLATNLAAAITVASVLGVAPTTVSISPVPRRLNPITLPSGTILIDDTHNANPLAVRESLNTLVKLAKLTKKNPVFVFAQMNELGKYEQSAHQESGLQIKSLNIRHLFCIGPATKFTIQSAGVGRYYENQDRMLTDVLPFVHDSKYVILVKGSRTWHLENLVSRLISSKP